MSDSPLSKLFDPEGLLSQRFPGFEFRPSQAEMMRDVWSSFQECQVALIEAGTGTGKSLAYLIPALSWALEKGERVVISTHTISLQQQLLTKDIPSLVKALNLSIKAVLVKGMNNYICRRKIEDASLEKRFLSEKEKADLEKIEEHVEKASEGSRSELSFVPSQETWERVGAEGENCTYVKCPHYKKCFFFKARQEAASAQILIVNHHLLFADLSMRAESENYQENCVLPPYSRLILDEAHHIEDVATGYFADRVSRAGWIRLLGRLLSERSTGKLKTLHQKIMEAYPGFEKAKEIQGWLDQLDLYLPAEKRSLLDHVDQTFRVLEEFLGLWEMEDKLRFRESHLAHPSWTNSVQPLAKETLQKMQQWIQSLLNLISNIEKDPSLKIKCEGVLAEISGLCERLSTIADAFSAFIFTPIAPKQVRWAEREGRFLSLVSANLDISIFLSQFLFQKMSTVVLCSATLASHHDFRFIRKQLGIEESIEKVYASPFNYAEQTLLAVPLDMPNPDHPHFTDQVVKNIQLIIETSRGNAFVLFTSYQMLQICKEKLEGFFKEKNYPLFCQGEEHRQILLDRFRKTERSILFGTDSFWEGVDVAGDALKCVIIAKLPFKVPSDPLFQARSEQIQEAGGSPFFEYSLPHAVMKFKQGFGRLIRTTQDYGCVVCLDPRILKKGYGRQFIKSLPVTQTCFDSTQRVIEEMAAFFHQKKKQNSLSPQ